MAAEDRAKLRDLLLPAATAVLGARTFDLILDDDGIALDLAGTRTPIATAAEIRDGTFQASFTQRVAGAAGVENPPPAAETRPAPQEIPIPWKTSELQPRQPPEPRRTADKPRRTPRSEPTPTIALSRMPPPRWVAEAAEMTGTVDAHAPEIHPICAPPRLTRRAQMILEEIEARHRE